VITKRSSVCLTLPMAYIAFASQLTLLLLLLRCVCMCINNSLFGLLGNLAPIASGRTMVYVKERLVNIGQLSDEGAFEGSIRVRTTLVLQSVFMHAAHTASVCVHLCGINSVTQCVHACSRHCQRVCTQMHVCMQY
jgi:hypothetical protein